MTDTFNPLPDTQQRNPTEILTEHSKQLEWQGKILNWTFGFLVAILIVCFVAFVTFILDAWRYHAESYQEYKSVLIEVSKKLQTPSPSPISLPKIKG